MYSQYKREILNSIKIKKEQDKLDRKRILPDKPAIYLDNFGVEYLYPKNNSCTKYCPRCAHRKERSYFILKHNGKYISKWCKTCIFITKVDAYHYQPSYVTIYRTLATKLQYLSDDLCNYIDIPTELIELERKKLILKTKINGKINQSS